MIVNFFRLTFVSEAIENNETIVVPDYQEV